MRKEVGGFVNVQVSKHKLQRKGVAGIDVPPAAVAMFERYVGHLRTGETNEHAKVFTSENGSPMSVSLVAQVGDELTIERLVDIYHIHACLLQATTMCATFVTFVTLYTLPRA